MITLSNLSLYYGERALFKKVNLNINQGEKVGVVGPNGAGKTTFLSIIMRKVEPSTGRVQIKKGVRIGYLPQETKFTSSTTVLSELIEGDEMIWRYKKEKEKLELENKAGSKRYGEILQKLEFLGYFDLEYRAKKILAGLGFKEKDFTRQINELSGGWQMRVLLAKLLIGYYDILLLDEPMNHLDLNAALWFKDYLTNFKGSFVMVSHDKAFLNEVTNYTLILEEGTITKFKGNYDEYVKEKEKKRIYLWRRFKEQEKKRQQLQRFISRFHAQPNKASQVRAKKRLLEKMEEIVLPPDRRESMKNFHFPEGRRSGYCVVRLEKISKSYGDNVVYKDFDFEVLRGEKAVLVGENGAGKSTLLKILAGVVDIDKGRRYIGHNVDIGYFSQTRMEVLNPSHTVLEEALSSAKGQISTKDVRTILGAFLFCGDDVNKNVCVLSGGEKSRLILAKLLINPPNFLLLDEPTTHLDTDGVDALIKALKEYKGTIVFISHDIHFVRSVANVVYEVKNGNVRKFPGSFDYYWQKVKEGRIEEEEPPQEKRVPVEETKKEQDLPEVSLQEEKRKRREHNIKIANRIKKLKKKKEKLEIERFAKQRVISNPRHGEDVIRYYEILLKEIEEKIVKIDEEINLLNSQFL